MTGVLLKIAFTLCSLFTVNCTHSECQLQLQIERAKLRCWTGLRKATAFDPSEGCAGIWDNFTCWMPARISDTISVPCPKYFGDFSSDHGKVSRNCTAEGWTNVFPNYMNVCGYNLNGSTEGSDTFYVRVMEIYTLGHSASLVALTTGSAILCFFRKLHCTRNYIHVNLFISFIIRAIVVLLKDGTLFSDHDPDSCNETALIGCKVILVFFQLFITANYCWLLVEGLYLHTLLMVFFSESKYFALYMLIGWGIPAFFTVIWIITRIYLDDTDCWDTNNHSVPWWTIRVPILASIILNFILFISIVRILIQKLRSPDDSGKDHSQFKRLAKSTLLLIPLLGVHYIVFAIFPDNVSNKYRIIFDLCFGSFQGFIAAILYCFLNREVQAELKRKWRSLASGCRLYSDYSLHRGSVSGNGTVHRNTRAQSLLQTETSLV
ncbi:vasoactive intestinal polypeptide receptor 2 isoform X1 [Amblyraja radiata]|uniref:vasoactive intestinal polypeptide receptor 2 isoform X1 n=2 Tax=Amblyraja radiata TaxID=386614 RepID=UPI0014022C54|nr:vasoactive intestinal polypeptide receptor 2 isoform X1 [Amblyraja radiata]